MQRSSCHWTGSVQFFLNLFFIFKYKIHDLMQLSLVALEVYNGQS